MSWLVLVIGSGIVAMTVLSQEHLAPLILSPYQSYQCKTVADEKFVPPQISDTAYEQSVKPDVVNDKPVFRILTVLHKSAEPLANTLCHSPLMKKYYSGVEIQWMPRSELTARQIIEEEFDLLWGRERQVEGIVPNFSQYYEALLHLPDYKVFWFSLTEEPVASAQYFVGKHIGLLEDMQSNSHFLLPLNSLKTLGVDLSTLKITYYPNYFLLENAFWRGEIDLISDGEWLRKKADHQQLYASLIDDRSSMGNWYVRVNRASATDCEILSGLQDLSLYQAPVNVEKTATTPAGGVCR